VKIFKLTKIGQAAVELAIFGSLIMTGFAVLLSYSQTFTEQQALQQQAFRMALRRAYDDNGFVSYNIIKHHRTPNIFGNFGQGNRESVSAGSSVLWSKGEAESFSYQQVNDDLREIPSYGDTPAEVWNIESSADTYYSGAEEKREDAAKITTTRSADLRDTITTTLKIRQDDVDYDDIMLVQGLCADGRYSTTCARDTIGKRRTWETPH